MPMADHLLQRKPKFPGELGMNYIQEYERHNVLTTMMT